MASVQDTYIKLQQRKNLYMPPTSPAETPNFGFMRSAPSGIALYKQDLA